VTTVRYEIFVEEGPDGSVAVMYDARAGEVVSVSTGTGPEDAAATAASLHAYRVTFGDAPWGSPA